MTSPVVGDGAVYGLSNTGRCTAFDPRSGETLWRTEAAYAGQDSDVAGDPVLAGDSLIVATEKGDVVCLDANTGAERWRLASSGVSVPMTVADGTLYFVDGALRAVDVETGAEQWANQSDYFFDSGPGVADGVVYVGSSSGTLYAIDAASGATNWSHEIGEEILSAITIAAGTVYAGTHSGWLAAVSTDGSQKWLKKFGNSAEPKPVDQSVAVAGDTVYVGNRGGPLRALDAANGSVRWVYEVEHNEGVLSAPVVADGTVYVCSHAVYAVDASNGQPKWQFPRGEMTESTPTVANGVLYVGAEGDGIFALTGSENQTPAATQTTRPPATTVETTTVSDTETRTEGAPSGETTESTNTPVQRGFLSNDESSDIGPLDDPFVLTVGGFALSVAGIIHQLIGGQ